MGFITPGLKAQAKSVFRHFKRSRVKSTWARHAKNHRVLVEWLEDTGRPTFLPDDLDPLLDHLAEKYGSEEWHKARVSEFRVSMQHWLGCHNRGAYPYWEGQNWKDTWNSVWYQAKEGKNLPRPEDRETMRGPVGQTMLVDMVAWVRANPRVCGLRHPETVVQALVLIHGCCLRASEFARIQVGDWNEQDQRLFLRCNKGMTVMNGNRTNIYYQYIKVIHPIARRILSERQAWLKVHRPNQKLLFSYSDFPLKEIRHLIKAASKALGWPQELHWTTHGLRHGGSQVLMQLYSQSNGAISNADFVSAVHMSRDTYLGTYGVPMDKRMETAYLRGKRNRPNASWN